MTPEVHLNYMDTVLKDMYSDFVRKKETLLKDALSSLGIDVDSITPEFAKEHLTCINNVYDKYEHYYFDFGLPTQKTLLTIEKEIHFSQNDTKINITSSFYK